MVLWILLVGRRGGGRGRETQRRARRTDGCLAETCRFYVQRWWRLVIHFLSIYRIPVLTAMLTTMLL